MPFDLQRTIIEFGGFCATDTTDEAVEYAELVEELGFDALWAIDSQQLYTELYVTLTVCAHATEEIELAPGITNPISRHPTVTASAMASLDQVAGGRTSLGIGAGDSAVYSVGKTPATVAELHEAATTIQALFDGQTVEFNEEPFTLETCERAPDVNVAAEGPKTFEMAGAVGNGVIFGGGPNPEIVETLGLENIRTGAQGAGRDMDDIRLIALTPACVADTRAAAVELLQPVIEPIAWHNFSFGRKDIADSYQEEGGESEGDKFHNGGIYVID